MKNATLERLLPIAGMCAIAATLLLVLGEW
jgi:hypothetical protein